MFLLHYIYLLLKLSIKFNLFFILDRNLSSNFFLNLLCYTRFRCYTFIKVRRITLQYFIKFMFKGYQKRSRNLRVFDKV